MKRFADFLYVVFLICTLISCTLSNQIFRGAGEMIQPGGQIGEMSVEQGERSLPYPHIFQFCEEMPDEHQPLTVTSECDLPLLAGLAVDFGWFARETKLASNWDSITWALYLNGHQVDLRAFDWHEQDFIAHGPDNKARMWLIDLKDLSPGKHTLRFVRTLKITLDDGFGIYQPGTYEHVVNFTVLEKTEYPFLSSNTNIGQHPYTSQESQLDSLLYLPGDYGKDPHLEWPLIVYLHGAHLRGAALELLLQEPLPRRLKKQSDFPFIVISPLGDGEHEFWATDLMIDPLFTLLDEIQTAYAVDPNRIYLTGNDMGGNGVWAIGLRRPAYFAALAPISGYYGYPFEVPENICDLKDVPVWAFHGGRDPFVPVDDEQSLVDALVACGGNARFTVCPRMKVDLPYNVYTDPELFDWFLEQSLK